MKILLVSFLLLSLFISSCQSQGKQKMHATGKEHTTAQKLKNEQADSVHKKIKIDYLNEIP